MKTQLNERDRQAIERLLQHMKEHCTEPFDAGKYASMVFFSESKLNKVFKLYAGVGPGTYYRRLRIRKAMELYQQQGIRSWTEISYILGYSDLAAFSKAFKKIHGVSPVSYAG